MVPDIDQIYLPALISRTISAQDLSLTVSGSTPHGSDLFHVHALLDDGRIPAVFTILSTKPHQITSDEVQTIRFRFTLDHGYFETKRLQELVTWGLFPSLSYTKRLEICNARFMAIGDLYEIIGAATALEELCLTGITILDETDVTKFPTSLAGLHSLIIVRCPGATEFLAAYATVVALLSPMRPPLKLLVLDEIEARALCFVQIILLVVGPYLSSLAISFHPDAWCNGFSGWDKLVDLSPLINLKLFSIGPGFGFGSTDPVWTASVARTFTQCISTSSCNCQVCLAGKFYGTVRRWTENYLALGGANRQGYVDLKIRCEMLANRQNPPQSTEQEEIDYIRDFFNVAGGQKRFGWTEEQQPIRYWSILPDIYLYAEVEEHDLGEFEGWIVFPQGSIRSPP